MILVFVIPRKRVSIKHTYQNHYRNQCINLTHAELELTQTKIQKLAERASPRWWRTGGQPSPTTRSRTCEQERGIIMRSSETHTLPHTLFAGLQIINNHF